MKLVIQVSLFERGISLQIREQEGIERAPGSETNVLHTIVHQEVYFNLRISATPELNASSLYVRGTSPGDDFKMVHRVFDTTARRDIFIERMRLCIAGYAEQNGVDFRVNDLGHTHILTINGDEQ